MPEFNCPSSSWSRANVLREARSFRLRRGASGRERGRRVLEARQWALAGAKCRYIFLIAAAAADRNKNERAAGGEGACESFQAHTRPRGRSRFPPNSRSRSQGGGAGDGGDEMKLSPQTNNNNRAPRSRRAAAPTSFCARQPKSRKPTGRGRARPGRRRRRRRRRRVGRHFPKPADGRVRAHNIEPIGGAGASCCRGEAGKRAGARGQLFAPLDTKQICLRASVRRSGARSSAEAIHSNKWRRRCLREGAPGRAGAPKSVALDTIGYWASWRAGGRASERRLERPNESGADLPAHARRAGELAARRLTRTDSPGHCFARAQNSRRPVQLASLPPPPFSTRRPPAIWPAGRLIPD